MKEKAYIIAFMVAVAAVFGAGVTGIHLVSKETIARNSAYLQDRALVKVLGLGDIETLSKAQVATILKERIESGTVTDPATGVKLEIKQGYGEDGAIKAVALFFDGQGFWGPIRGYVALTPNLTAARTLGLVITEQSETPGLGGRIEEPVFTDQFYPEHDPRGGDGVLAAPADGNSPIVVMGGEGPRSVDAITGATQTSMAMERILNQHLQAFHRAMNAATATPGQP